MKEDNIICDTCENYYRHPSGCSERCYAVKREPFSRFTDGYAETRFLGNAKSCKEYKKIRSL